MTKASETARRQNLICNFRAPNPEYHQIWLDYKEAARSLGLDICYLTLTLCQAWLKAIQGREEATRLSTATQVINVQMQNTFVYNVQKPRREPTELICSRKEYTRTLRSLLFQAYVMEKARDLQRSFLFRDFPELGHNLFRKCVLELKKRGKILPLQPRTNPRFYILREWVPDYPTMKGNNRVKPRFTRDSTRWGE
ncbi:MAG: hypothetical protein ACFFB3_21670 [Candidatus Hodarchaeota archaeon]